MKKYIPYILFLLPLQFLCDNTSAQVSDTLTLTQTTQSPQKDGFFKKLINGIFNPKIKYDTLYIGKPYGKWLISVNENFMQNKYFQFTGMGTYTIKNNICMTTGLSFAYKGIGFGYSVNFRKLNGKTTDRDMTFNLYSNCFGIDFRMYNVGDFYDEKYDEHWPEKSYLKGLNINAYYVFNNKKFSYSSAFSYSKVQKRNAGSVIAGISFYTDKLWSGKDAEYFKEAFANVPTEIEIDETIRVYLSDWKTEYLSVGAGYAYNWVPSPRWLIHASAELSQMAYQNMVVTYNDVTLKKPAGVSGSEMTVTLDNPTKKLPYYFFNFTGNGRFSATYSWKRGYVGVYYIGTMNFISLKGAEDIMSESNYLIYHWWNAKLSVGFRF